MRNVFCCLKIKEVNREEREILNTQPMFNLVIKRSGGKNERSLLAIHC